jgi:hypothetical protein
MEINEVFRLKPPLFAQINLQLKLEAVEIKPK